jgi:hypothetical protein
MMKSLSEEMEEEALTKRLKTPYQLEPPANSLKRVEVEEVIRNLNPKKSSDCDLITGKILKELPIVGIKYLTQLFNTLSAAMESRTDQPHLDSRKTCYRPINLLPIVSEVSGKLLLKRPRRMVEDNRIIPNQFGFRQRHSTVQQPHQIVRRINKTLQNKQYASATFLDISSIQQSMAYWTSVQIKTVSPSELVPYPKILFT